MIKTKEDLKFYLNKDYERNDVPPKWWKRFGGSEVNGIYTYFRDLRYLEYYSNNRNGTLNKLLYFFFLFKHNHHRLKINIYVEINTFGPGVLFVHPGFLRVVDKVKIGSNCTILPNVLIGKKLPDVKNHDITIGDNAYISTNVTILGPLILGNNVTIAAGSVVTKNFPDNVVIGGVPAKIIKFK
jgi:serine O-acetyltransferase